MLVYLIVEACMKLKRTKISEDNTLNEKIRGKEPSDKTGGANNSDHDCAL